MMQSNHIVSTIFGASVNGQNSVIAVVGTHQAALRELVVHFARGFFRSLEGWCALILKRTPAATATPWYPTLAAAMCPTMSADRRQRDQRWMSGVAVDPGTVGVR